MLNLLRYSQLLALAVLVAVVAALALLYRDLVSDALVEAETHASVALTKTFANAVWPAHADFVKRAASLDRRTLAERPELAALDHDLRQLASGLSVVKVKIYDLNGLTVYSTDRRQIGENKLANPGYLRARDGYPASNITYRESFDAWEGQISDRHILATYVPVHGYDAAPVEAVLEVYSDVTDLVARMHRSQWTILAAVLGAMALIYLVIQLILVRYNACCARRRRRASRRRSASATRRITTRSPACPIARASASSSRRHCVAPSVTARRSGCCSSTWICSSA